MITDSNSLLARLRRFENDYDNDPNDRDLVSEAADLIEELLAGRAP